VAPPSARNAKTPDRANTSVCVVRDTKNWWRVQIPALRLIFVRPLIRVMRMRRARPQLRDSSNARVIDSTAAMDYHAVKSIRALLNRVIRMRFVRKSVPACTNASVGPGGPLMVLERVLLSIYARPIRVVQTLTARCLDRARTNVRVRRDMRVMRK